jgi:DNA-binding CsgD family transcriptional regulator
MVDSASLGVVVIELPAGVIVGANEAMRRLLLPGGGLLAGRTAAEFMGGPTGGARLVLEGHISGYEVVRHVQRDTDPPVTINALVRALDDGGPRRFLLVLCTFQEDEASPTVDGAETTPMLGTTNRHLLVDGVSGDCAALGYTPEALLGESLFTVIADSSVTAVLAAVARAVEHRGGESLTIDVRAASGRLSTRELLILPLQPPPSIAFALVPVAGEGPRHAEYLAAHTAHAFGAEHELTTRERDIVERLLSGDRVPAIARSLFLSQSTVRNHLASAFAKLGVSSQQELIDLFRGTRSI